MPGIGLQLDPGLRPSDDLVQDAYLLGACASFTEAAANFDFEDLLKFGFIPVEVFIDPRAVKSSP